MTECPCGEPTTSGYLCRSCAKRLDEDLRQIAALWPESHTTLTRQDRVGPGGSRGSGGAHGLPVSLAASETRDYVRLVVSTWLRHLAGDRTPEDVRTIAQACRWLELYSSAWLLLPEVIELAEQIADAAQRLRWLVDRRADRIVVGQCDVCGSDLTAYERSSEATCRPCERVVDVGSVRQARIDALMDYHGSDADVAELLTSMYGVAFTPATVGRWVDQRRLWRNGMGLVPFRRAVELGAQHAAPRRRRTAG
ncbi:hypothetical protein [Cumulibacter soli]|uniref:hypothetical protein n=1 Tax=Cumulibacter soli TaxID=2546344 RepID=UPI001067B81E|nr:hypothetical protein [Cumulibacter soli]